MSVLYHLRVNNFRGIRSLDWHTKSRVICIVGPGDSAKTTILNAIELVFLPRLNIPFTDSDFYLANASDELIIEATVGELPESLIKQERYGLYLRGYSTKEFTIHDDPNDDDEDALTIRLSVDSSLEPQWFVVKDSNPDPKTISWRDRELLGIATLGDDADRNLTWSRGSALARLTDSKSSGHIIAVANRKAQEAVGEMALDEWKVIAENAKAMAKEYGVNIANLQPGLDVRAIRFGQSVLSLFDGSVPLQYLGLGSKRLAALAVQDAGIGKSSVILLDEVEYGLEPHRIRKLLKILCEDRKEGQVMMTSHSPTTVVALSVEKLRFARYINGLLEILSCDDTARDAMQAVIRRCPMAVFARSVIICEGKTEEALCRRLSQFWSAKYKGRDFSLLGIVPVLGEGTNASRAALQFTKLGYRTAFFGDSDKAIDPNEQIMRDSGTTVIMWDGQMAIEQRVACDVPLDIIQDLLNAAKDIKGDKSCLDSCKTELVRLGINQIAIDNIDINDWLQRGIQEPIFRAAIGNAAKISKWFKNLNDGWRLADLVVTALPRITGTPLWNKLQELEQWSYAE